MGRVYSGQSSGCGSPIQTTEQKCHRTGLEEFPELKFFADLPCPQGTEAVRIWGDRYLLKLFRFDASFGELLESNASQSDCPEHRVAAG